MDVTFLIFQLLVLLFSVMLHEVSHGYVAESLGDPTARLQGRLTFNPLKHLDPFGSVILPLSLFLLTGGRFLFGWAKPVPYNPNNLNDPQAGAGKIAAAGPISNLIIAGIFGIVLRMAGSFSNYSQLSVFLSFVVYINILLAIFNLLPLPPLDGSKILFAFLPVNNSTIPLISFLETYGMFLLILFIFFGFGLLLPAVDALYLLIAGHPPPF